MADLLIVVGILVLLAVCFIYWVISEAVKGLYGLLPWVRKRRREAERRWLEEQIKEQQERERQEQERQRQEQARHKVIEDAKKQFEEAVMGGRFPSDEVLAILADCDSDIPTNLKEAVEELLYGRCSLHSMAFGDAVRLIQQRQRTAERAKARAARADGHGSEPTGPVTKIEAYDLLGVTPGCSPEELAAAYHRKVFQWHPDKLETMADELKTYATRRTARINEAYHMLRRA
ncbi:MAG: J domain-containing protein [Terriglobales bacterium]